MAAEETSLDPAQLFAEDMREIWLEIGFGSGEHLAQQAIENPSVGIIGCEPYINGVARLLADIDQHNLTNVKIYRDDARILLRALQDISIARTFILFPDPWPKMRHHKRAYVEESTPYSSGRLSQYAARRQTASNDTEMES